MLLHQRGASQRRHRQGKGVVMTRDDVIRMALECGLLDARDDTLHDDGIAQFVGTLSDFAALVAQQEREACAMVCDERSDLFADEGGDARSCANAIRARGAK